MKEPGHHMDGMQLDRQLAFTGLMPEEGLKSFLHGVILLQREQPKGSEAKSD